MSHSRITFRASKGSPCPVCTSDTKGCSATDDGLHLCRGTNPGIGWVCLYDKNEGWRGYRHESDLRRGGPRQLPAAPTATTDADTVTAPAAKKQKRVHDWQATAARLARSMRPDARGELAAALRLPVEALDAITGLGTSGRSLSGWTFTLPERDAAGKVIGISQRFPDRSKKMLTGGHRGLTLPPRWIKRPGPALCVEGPTDTAAMWFANLACVGRPSNAGGVAHLAELYADFPADRDIIIVGENDQKENGNWPGRDGAEGVATALAKKLGRCVKWSLPPAGVKDVRDWLTNEGHNSTPWAYRGAELLAYLTATAVTVEPKAARPAGYDGISAEEAAQLMAEQFGCGPVDPCAITAAADVREQLTPTCRCDDPRVMIGRKTSSGRRGAVPFGCHKNACDSCGMFKKALLFDSTEPYMRRLTTTGDDPNESGGLPIKMLAYQLVVPTSQNVAVKRTVERRKGTYLAIDTTDALGCMELIADGADVSQTRHTADPPACPISDSGAYTLWTVLLPIQAKPIKGFIATGLATSYQVMGNAFVSTPAPDESVKRFRPIRKSRKWGDKIEKAKGDFQPEGLGIFTQEENRQFADELRVMCSFWFADPRVQGRPVGWDAPQAASLCFSLLLRGVGAPHEYTIDRVIDLGREWLKVLPKDIGDGWRVAQVLREHLWNGPPAEGLIEELRKADEQDKDEEAEEQAVAAAAMPLLHSLRQHYRDLAAASTPVSDPAKFDPVRHGHAVQRRYREIVSEASELVRMLLA